MMETILAADNLNISLSQGWQLKNGEQLLASVTSEGLQYSLAFGTSRRLPAEGLITRSDIEQVVLGWQASDELWHLGLVLAPHLAQTRQSRWCAIAHWPDPDASVFGELAQEAGNSLAKALGVPFVAVPAQVPQVQVTPSRPLPPLPLHLGDWQLRAILPQDAAYDASPEALVLEQSGRWMRQQVWRALTTTLSALLYFIISIATLGSDLALPNSGTLIPNPHLLPYLGIVIGIGMFLLSLWRWWEVLRGAKVWVLDGQNHRVSQWYGTRQGTQLDSASLQSLYVSELVKRRDKSSSVDHGELNFHLGGGRFSPLLLLDKPFANLATHPEGAPETAREEGVILLSSADYRTDLQAAALHIGTILRLPVWSDTRFK